MLHVTFMGGAEVRVKEEDNMVITMCGETEILMPTIAEMIIYLNRVKTSGNETVRRTNVITLMGATVTKYPTLGSEILEMIRLRESGMFTDEQLGSLWREVLQQDNMDSFEFFTFMGGAGDDHPSEREEVKSLKELLILGVINQEEMEQYEAMIRGKTYSFRKLPSMEKFREIMMPPRPLVQLSSERTLLAKSSLSE